MNMIPQYHISMEYHISRIAKNKPLFPLFFYLFLLNKVIENITIPQRKFILKTDLSCLNHFTLDVFSYMTLVVVACMCHITCLSPFGAVFP